MSIDIFSLKFSKMLEKGAYWWTQPAVVLILQPFWAKINNKNETFKSVFASQMYLNDFTFSLNKFKFNRGIAWSKRLRFHTKQSE